MSRTIPVAMDPLAQLLEKEEPCKGLYDLLKGKGYSYEVIVDKSDEEESVLRILKDVEAKEPQVNSFLKLWRREKQFQQELLAIMARRRKRREEEEDYSMDLKRRYCKISVIDSDSEEERLGDATASDFEPEDSDDDDEGEDINWSASDDDFSPRRDRAKKPISSLSPNSHACRWQKRYHQLKEHKEQHGTCYVGPHHDSHLRAWVYRQREYNRHNTLRQHRKKLLERLGFDFDSRAKPGRQSSKSTLVPTGQAESNSPYQAAQGTPLQQTPPLEQAVIPANLPGEAVHPRKVDSDEGSDQEWVPKDYHEDYEHDVDDVDELSTHRKKFSSSTGWLARYNQVKEYYEEHGTSKIPKTQHKELALWTYSQRKIYHQGKLPLRKIALLQEVDFDFTHSPPFSRWLDSYKLLEQFYEKHRHSNATLKNADKRLECFARHQREAKKNDTLSEEKIMLLNKLHFVWELHPGRKNPRKGCTGGRNNF